MIRHLLGSKIPDQKSAKRIRLREALNGCCVSRTKHSFGNAMGSEELHRGAFLRHRFPYRRSERLG
jgi:hypothetical protein